MFTAIIPKVRKVIELAKKRNANYTAKYPSGNKGIVDMADIADYDGDNALKEYLYSLSYEDIKMIEAIMYIGRDKDFNDMHSPEEIVKEQIETLDFPNDKGVEIEHIISKAPLDSYLIDGLKMLGQL